MDETYLRRREANFRALTPLNFLLRAEDIFPDRVAVIDDSRSFTWRQHADRCRRLASALKGEGLQRGDVVSVLAPNTSAMIEAHFGVPMAGGVICALNVRLDAAMIAFILEHSESRVLLADKQYGALAQEALALVSREILVIGIDAPGVEGKLVGTRTYEAFLAGGDPNEEILWPLDEWDTIALDYTSGTTGDPKGALYHHRGTYLNSLGQLLTFGISEGPVYLWTLPMFHCNGWCFSWGIAAALGTHVCLRKVAAETIFAAISQHGVTHLSCAPTVMSFLIEGAVESGATLAHPVDIMTAGASPPRSVLLAIEDLGFRVRHVYGMTEMHGVIAACTWHPEWDALSGEQRALLRARQGIRTVVCDDMAVLDPETFVPVPRDGKTMGEIMLRGSVAMKGYFRNPTATEASFAGGWYHSGDLAVVHPDGYAEIRDRSKDIIISGGENIASVEIEQILCTHPAIFSAAVIPIKHDRWGETPCAFVELRPDYEGKVTAEEIISFCRARMAKFKVPRDVKIGPIDRTATGKVQKFKLRALAESD
ncbi:MAG: acyl-CoA synthetase [Bradyrhizobium sp.]|nr:acyl-CoA synthetase [Bradyrhizobium sp.]